MKKAENAPTVSMASAIAALRADVESLRLGLDARLSRLERTKPINVLELTLCLVPLVVMIVVGMCLLFG